MRPKVRVDPHFEGRLVIRIRKVRGKKRVAESADPFFVNFESVYNLETSLERNSAERENSW
ncbi:hypothetical protein SK128_006913 [Halocaridina rubra]|uniref:Uncharacterized protein n=1 Tax=Halocaridina rubra TaxID=373956 RepID=A0AAN9FU89_HALRR